MVYVDRRLTQRGLVALLVISLGSVSDILIKVLGFRTLCAQRVPYWAFTNDGTSIIRRSQEHLEIV